MPSLNRTIHPPEFRRFQKLLGDAQGREYWNRLEKLAATPEFRSYLEREFPSQLWRLDEGTSRRDFLRVMGASLVLAGLGSCTRQPDEKIVPAARSPESSIPGVPRYFATSMPVLGGALGLVVESHMGRPTKIEGNPDHPASLGATNSFAQAEILSLYDPERSRVVLRGGRIATYSEFLTELKAKTDEFAANGGKGLVILTEEITSPSVAFQLQKLRETYPEAVHIEWQPVHANNARRGVFQALGANLNARYRFDQADVIVSFDADFLCQGPGAVRYAKDYSARRKNDSLPPCRFYAIETTPTPTGTIADHQQAVTNATLDRMLRFLARELGVEDVEIQGELSTAQRGFLVEIAKDLKKHAGKGIVLGGESGEGPTAEGHAILCEINAVLGNAGNTVYYTQPVSCFDEPIEESSLKDLLSRIQNGGVDTLVTLGGNPVYQCGGTQNGSAGQNLDFAGALKKVPFRVHLSSHEDETSRLCHWHIPESHFLESWGDTRAFDGTRSVLQPLIAPLYQSKTALDVLLALRDQPGQNIRDVIQKTWQELGWLSTDEATAEKEWQTVLHDGFTADSSFPPVDPGGFQRQGRIAGALKDSDTFEVNFRLDAATLDGRYANNGWLQETPRPLTRLTWGNALLLSPADATSKTLDSGDVVEFSVGERTVEGPVWVQPGHPQGLITVHWGYGRTAAGRVGNGIGFNAFRLQTQLGQARTQPGQSVALNKTGRRQIMACVQDHQRMEGRNLVRQYDRDERIPPTGQVGGHAIEDLSLYPEYQYNGNAWGMVIDLSSCVGCNACMVACQSENNIPIVGKTEVEKGRELHWMRIDRYYEGDEHDPTTLHQPVPCMHCEAAPCEVVCPVRATVHNSEGLNDMVYNRCVGTRYCSNNCPYKVRRFNFFGYSDHQADSLKLGRNPDVTVRTLGVMEKCTYCVQRINAARIDAKNEGREIREGEITTACQGVCPTEAITFGDINNQDSKIAALRAKDHHYALLEELGTRPRTTYLARMTNKNPALLRDAEVSSKES